jgi:hypothetical protein
MSIVKDRAGQIRKTLILFAVVFVIVVIMVIQQFDLSWEDNYNVK